MTKLDTYIFFDGKCADAMRFYERVLRGKLEILMTGGESPAAEQLPPGKADRILHARLAFDGGVLLASDWMAAQPYEGMHGFSLSVSTPTMAEAQRLFHDLADGGRVTMPFEKTFWAEGFGSLVDRFGTAWMVNVDQAAP